MTTDVVGALEHMVAEVGRATDGFAYGELESFVIHLPSTLQGPAVEGVTQAIRNSLSYQGTRLIVERGQAS